MATHYKPRLTRITKNRTLRQALKILILLLLYTSTFAQSKTGFIDYERVILSVPDYKVELKEFGKVESIYQDTLQRFITELLRFLEKSVPRNSKMDSTELRDLEDVIRQKEKEFRDYQLTAQSKIIELQKKIEERLKDRMLKALEKFCTDNAIISIAEKDGILFCPYCKDYTDDFIKYLAKETTR